MNDTFTISLASGATFTAQRDENLLVAAQRAQWLIRYGCRNGNCEACEAQLLKGSVQHRDTRINASGQTILLCQAIALSDLTLALAVDPVPGNLDQARRFYAQLTQRSIDGANARLEFLLPAGRKPAVLADQYALLELDSGVLQLPIDAAASTTRKLILHAAADLQINVGDYYYLRYPIGVGTPP